jgi:Uma2 family endonuclease
MKQSERAVLRRWTRQEYERLIDHGFLDEDDPIELLDGLLLVKEPPHSLHRTAVLLVAKAVERAFGAGWFVQVQSPIILDDRSEPEPDVCVVRGSPRDYVLSHPRRPSLVIEVAQSGLPIARGRKAAAYARARIADYWIVNLTDRVLEAHREPASRGPARRHWGYASIVTTSAGHERASTRACHSLMSPGLSTSSSLHPRAVRVKAPPRKHPVPSSARRRGTGGVVQPRRTISAANASSASQSYGPSRNAMLSRVQPSARNWSTILRASFTVPRR